MWLLTSWITFSLLRWKWMPRRWTCLDLQKQYLICTNEPVWLQCTAKCSWEEPFFFLSVTSSGIAFHRYIRLSTSWLIELWKHLSVTSGSSKLEGKWPQTPSSPILFVVYHKNYTAVPEMVEFLSSTGRSVGKPHSARQIFTSCSVQWVKWRSK